MLLTGIFWSVSLKSTEQVKFYILQRKWSRVKLGTYSAEKFAEDDQVRCARGPRGGQGRPEREEGAGPGLGRIPGRC